MPFVGDGGIEGREVDRPHRLRAEHERVVAHAFAVDLRFDRERANAVEAALGVVFDAAVEQVDGREILRIFERAAQRDDAADRRRSSSASSSPARARGRRRSAAA